MRGQLGGSDPVKEDNLNSSLSDCEQHPSVMLEDSSAQESCSSDGSAIEKQDDICS